MRWNRRDLGCFAVAEVVAEMKSSIFSYVLDSSSKSSSSRRIRGSRSWIFEVSANCSVLILFLFCLFWPSMSSASTTESCTFFDERAERIGRAFQSLFEKYIDYHDLLHPVAVSICQNRLSIYYTTPLGCTAMGLPGATGEHGINFRIDVVSEQNKSAAGVSLGGEYFLYPRRPERRLSIDREDRYCFQRQLRTLGRKALFRHDVKTFSEAAPRARCEILFGDERAERLRIALYPYLSKVFDIPSLLEIQTIRFCSDSFSVSFEFPKGCVEDKYNSSVMLSLFGAAGAGRIYPSCPPLFSCTEIKEFSHALTASERVCLHKYWAEKWQVVVKQKTGTVVEIRQSEAPEGQ